MSAFLSPGLETSGLRRSVLGGTPPETCCVLPFRAKVGGTTQTGCTDLVESAPELGGMSKWGH